jgi:hypothetical protein
MKNLILKKWNYEFRNRKKIVVILISGTGKIFVCTKLPTTFPIVMPDESMSMKIETQQGYAIEYVKENFGIEHEILDAKYYCEGG